MGIPLLLPLLLGAGSIAANTIGANRAANAQAAAMAAERTRQNQLDEEAYALNKASQDRYEDFGQQQQAKSADLAALFTSALDAPPARPVGAAPATSSNVISNLDASEAGKARSEAEDRAGRLGNLNSFGDLFGDTTRLQARDAGQIGMIGGFKRGSQNVLPLELNAAATKGRGWMMLGDLLNLGSGATLQGALSGGGSLAGLFGGGKLFGGNSWGA